MTSSANFVQVFLVFNFEITEEQISCIYVFTQYSGAQTCAKWKLISFMSFNLEIFKEKTTAQDI
jgi:hypothetical protein